MKKILILFLTFLLLLTGCRNLSGSKLNKLLQKNELSITNPSVNAEIIGNWKFNKKIVFKEKNSDIEIKNLFISKEVFELNEVLLLNPKITARYIDSKKYFSAKGIEIPKDLVKISENMIVYKITNNLSISQEFIKIDENKMLTIYLGEIFLFEKENDLSKEIIEKKKKEVELKLTGKKTEENKGFGLAVSFRKKNTKDKELSYNYHTYYIKKNKDNNAVDIISVRDVVIPKDIGLWTISQNKIIKNDSNIKTYKVSAAPTFNSVGATESNKIEDNVYRRIDYVNDDFLAFTRFNFSKNSISENYEIHNINTISKRNPIKISTVGGDEGYKNYLSLLIDNLNILGVTNKNKLVEVVPDPTNIGMKRFEMGWKYISGMDIQTEDNGNRVFKILDLNLIPIINLGENLKTNITWRDILSKVPTAIDAVISPDEDFLLIQDKNRIDFYPIYFNYISDNPIFSIQDTSDYELVMNKWLTEDKVEEVFKEYNKLEKIDTKVIHYR